MFILFCPLSSTVDDAVAGGFGAGIAAAAVAVIHRLLVR